jgi:Raf kinase inhibitor-like YbhB/YbcL family protein
MRVILISTLAIGLLNARAGAQAFTLRSDDIPAGGTIPAAQVYNGMGCTGRNVSPSLLWTNAPANTRSFAVTMYDPDAPTGSGWWHWVVYNIPATRTVIAAGAGDPARRLLPPGALQGHTDFGSPGYGGPCPPAGSAPHRYVFTVFALDVDKIDVPFDATAALIGFNLHAHTIAKASFTARYGR